MAWIVYRGQRPLNLLGATALTLQPNWLYDIPEGHAALRSRSVEAIESPAAFFRDHEIQVVAFVRRAALGDILMLLPICRALQRWLPSLRQIFIAIDPRFVPALASLQEVLGIVRFCKIRYDGSYGAQATIDLNRVLEIDHRTDAEDQVHRVLMYARHLGLTGRFACLETESGLCMSDSAKP